MNKKLPLLLIISILILGVFFRFAYLDKKYYWYDEVYTSLRISGYTEEEIRQQVYDGRVISLQDLQRYQRTNQDRGVIDTAKGLAKEEAQLPPLYFALVRFWVHLFGNSVVVTRSFSALLSVLALLFLYFLCQELFKSPMVGWVAVALMTVSPFQIIYAQAARQYSLWTLTTLLSGWALLRALRIGDKFSWGIYSISIILGLYTSPFSLFITLGQGLYVVALERFQINKTVRNYILSFVVGIFAFSPWLLIMILRLHQIKGKTDWSSSSYSHGILELIFNWFRNITRLFLDFDQLNSNFEYTYNHPVFYVFTVIPIILLSGYSIYFLCRNTPLKTWFFILIFIGGIALPLVLQDLILGGRRSGTARYIIPSYLGIQISVAYFLSAQAFSASTRIFNQKIWQIVLVLLFSLGILSSAYVAPKQFWWSNDPPRHLQEPQIAMIINQSNKPLIISDKQWAYIVSLSYNLKPNVKFQLSESGKLPEIPDGYSDYFLYRPSASLEEVVEKKFNYNKRPVYKIGDPWLWKLEKNIRNRPGGI